MKKYSILQMIIFGAGLDQIRIKLNVRTHIKGGVGFSERPLIPE